MVYRSRTRRFRYQHRLRPRLRYLHGEYVLNTAPKQQLRERLISANEHLIGAAEHHAAIAEAIAALAPPSGDKPRCGEEHYELDAYIWRRESTQSWVLELSGCINDTTFITRHSEPLTTKPQDVASLPSLYAVGGEGVLIPLEAVSQAAAALDVLGRRDLAAWLMRSLATPPPASQERGGLQVFHCREADDGEVVCAKWCGNRTYCPVSGQAEPSPPSSAAEGDQK